MHALIRASLRVASALALTLAVLAVTPHPSHAQRSTPEAVEFFYDSLEPHGVWVEHPDYGLVWHPRNVGRDWRPYSRGRWVNTEEYGWYWESDERFGWAAYHYGRWGYDDEFDWFWVPGDEWGPAWVDWRSGDGFIGWAPLPPGVAWHSRDHRFDYGSIDLGAPRYRNTWSFVPERHFVDGDVRRHMLPYRTIAAVGAIGAGVFLFERTRRATDYRSHDNHVVNRSIDLGHLRSVTGAPLAPVPVRRAESHGALPTPHRGQGHNGQVTIYNPAVTPGIRPQGAGPRGNGPQGSGPQGSGAQVNGSKGTGPQGSAGPNGGGRPSSSGTRPPQVLPPVQPRAATALPQTPPVSAPAQGAAPGPVRRYYKDGAQPPPTTAPSVPASGAQPRPATAPSITPPVQQQGGPRQNAVPAQSGPPRSASQPPPQGNRPGPAAAGGKPPVGGSGGKPKADEPAPAGAPPTGEPGRYRKG